MINVKYRDSGRQHKIAAGVLELKYSTTGSFVGVFFNGKKQTEFMRNYPNDPRRQAIEYIRRNFKVEWPY